MNPMFMLKKLGRVMVKHAPTILAWTGVAGVWATAYTLHKADEAVRKEDINDVIELATSECYSGDFSEDLEFYHKQNVKTHCKRYILAGGIGLASSACIILGDRTSCKRIAQLSGALILAKRKIQDYRTVIETRYGKDILNEIDKDVTQIHINRSDLFQGDLPLWCEPHTGAIFSLSEQDFDVARIGICADYIGNGTAYFNDWLKYLKLDRRYDCCTLGWTQNGGWMQGPYMDISYTIQKRDGIEVRVIDYGDTSMWPSDDWMWWGGSDQAAEEWRSQYFQVEGIDPLCVSATDTFPNEDDGLVDKIVEAEAIQTFFKDEGIEPDFHVLNFDGPGVDFVYDMHRELA